LSLGVERDGGSRIVGISGHVNTPGLFEVGVGVTLREMIYGPGGGISEGRALKAVIPGGSSCPVLKPDEIDVPMTVDAMAKAGTMLGTCGIIVIAEGTCLLKCLQRISHFYAHESCGQCTPCREGTGWLARIIDDLEAGRGQMSDIAMLVDIADQIGGNTICALGDAASLPVQSFVKKFRAEFEAHVTHGGCPHAHTPLPGWKKPAGTQNRGPQKG
jgi:NADH-quinone oxidoreductase subunit F